MEQLSNQIEKLRNQLKEQFTAAAKNHPIVTGNSIAQMIDHTLLKPEATQAQIDQLCSEAIENNFYAVCIQPAYLLHAHRILKDSSVTLATVVGFPTGASTTETKVFETLDAIDNGAQEIDMVLNIGKLKSGMHEVVYQDIALVVAQAETVPVKVILETSLLTQEEKIIACILSEMAGAAFVKTSTGFSTGGATLEDIDLMRQVVGKTMGIKASGGIKDLKTAQAMIKAGATRIGTSSGISIIKEQK